MGDKTMECENCGTIHHEPFPEKCYNCGTELGQEDEQEAPKEETGAEDIVVTGDGEDKTAGSNLDKTKK